MPKKTVIELPQINTSDMLDERNNFLIFNNESGQTLRANDLQMDERFLSSRSLFADQLKTLFEKSNEFPVAVSAGNDIVLRLGQYPDYSSLSGRIDLVEYSTGKTNTYKFSYMISEGVIEPLEFVWHENHSYTEKGVTSWFVGQENNELVIRIATENVYSNSESILVNVSDLSIGL